MTKIWCSERYSFYAVGSTSFQRIQIVSNLCTTERVKDLFDIEDIP